MNFTHKKFGVFKNRQLYFLRRAKLNTTKLLISRPPMHLHLSASPTHKKFECKASNFFATNTGIRKIDIKYILKDPNTDFRSIDLPHIDKVKALIIFMISIKHNLPPNLPCHIL